MEGLQRLLRHVEGIARGLQNHLSWEIRPFAKGLSGGKFALGGISVIMMNKSRRTCHGMNACFC